jgi:molecular chaperone DnaJ
MEVTVDLDFRSAVFGTSKEIRVRVPVPCETCGATGARPGTSPVTCTTCGGAGEVRQVRQSILGQMVTARPCPSCGGLGQQITSPCPDCRGEGRRTEEKAYTVDIPAGVDDGNTLQLGGRGAAGPRGGRPGDLFVHLRVKPDEQFIRQGNDIVHVLHVPMSQAALGAHLRYETLDGTEDLVIPRATQPGKVFRLRGRGVPDVNGRGRGDLLVQVVVDTPIELTKEQEDVLRLYAAARGEEVAPAETGFLAKVRSAFK